MSSPEDLSFAHVRDRLAAIEAELRRIRKAHRELAGRFEEMTKADEIAQAVTTAIDAQRRRRFTFTRKTGAALAGAVLLVPAVHNAASWWFGL